MKLRAKVVTLLPVVLCLSQAPAFAAPLDKVEEGYVMAVVAAAAVSTQCPGYKLVLYGPRTFADKLGVNFDKFNLAIVAAWSAQLGIAYERKNLIPEVTRLTNDTHKLLHDGFALDRQGTCRRWIDGLPAGLLTLK